MHPAAWRQWTAYTLTHVVRPLPPLITMTDVLPGTSIMTSGFTISWDGRRAAMSCRLVVSVVHHSSVGLAERWADLQNLHPQIFLKFQSLCKLSNPRYSLYHTICVHCSFTSHSECVTTVSWVPWSQWPCHMSIRLLRHYGGRWLAWLVRDYGLERQRGSKQGSYIQADCAVPCLTAEAHRITAIAIMWWSWQSEWSWRERRVITTALLSVATSNTQRPTPSSLTPHGLVALHVRLLSEIHSTQAWMFISLVLHGKWDLDPRTVHNLHIRKN